MYLFFDCETNGLPVNYGAHVHDVENWPRMLQLAWQLYDAKGALLRGGNYLIKPEGFELNAEAAKIHGLTMEKLMDIGYDVKEVLKKFAEDMALAEKLIGHNISFDKSIVGAEIIRAGMEKAYEAVKGKEKICTMHSSTQFCALQGPRGYKWPKLQELHKKLFGEEFLEAHDAEKDVAATAKCFFELKKLNIIKA